MAGPHEKKFARMKQFTVAQLLETPPEPTPYVRCTGSVFTGSSNCKVERRLYVVRPGRPRLVVIRIAPAEPALAPYIESIEVLKGAARLVAGWPESTAWPRV